MDFLGVSGMHYSGESLAANRIVEAEDSNVFASMIRQRMRELLELDVEICRTFEDLQAANELDGEPIRLP